MPKQVENYYKYRLQKEVNNSVRINEVSERYGVPLDILEQYESWNLNSREVDSYQYDNEDIEKLGMIMTLYNIGFCSDEIEQYMRLHLQGIDTASERIKILQEKRNEILEEIHNIEKKIEDLDYLRYMIKLKE